MEFDRYLQLSITPKSHIIEDHAFDQQSLFYGIIDLAEIFGEKNHRYKSIADRQHGGTRDLSLCEKIKSKEEARFNNPGFKDKVNNIKNKRNREHPVSCSTI